MSRRRSSPGDQLWAHHHALWRDPAQVVAQWREADRVDPQLLRHRTRGAWWETVAETRATLLITREYEHLVIAISVSEGKPRVSYMPLPHPSGLVVDRPRKAVYVASTRNPNQVYELRRVTGLLQHPGTGGTPAAGHPLVPVRSTFLPGCLYIHDLALVGGTLHANAVGHNAVVRLRDDGGYRHVWWPRCIEQAGRPLFERNHLQLNSIAAGDRLRASFFSASTDCVSARRPGQLHFPVDRRGVIFSGRTREPMARELTRPHSARLHGGNVWVDNSGYGEVGFVDAGRLSVVHRLPGWTRGLCFCGDIAFVGTSRVIPRFSRYAPGLAAGTSECGVHAVNARTGAWLGSLCWPMGNQVFAIDWLPTRDSLGFPFTVRPRRGRMRERDLFSGFQTEREEKRE